MSKAITLYDRRLTLFMAKASAAKIEYEKAATYAYDVVNEPASTIEDIIAATDQADVLGSILRGHYNTLLEEVKLCIADVEGISKQLVAKQISTINGTPTTNAEEVANLLKILGLDATSVSTVNLGKAKPAQEDESNVFTFPKIKKDPDKGDLN